MGTPTMAASRTGTSPSVRESWAPKTTRVMTSRPSWSVPNGNGIEGPMSFWPATTAVGLLCMRNGPKMARAKIESTPIRPTWPER
jgi:hypothetical protein